MRELTAHAIDSHETNAIYYACNSDASIAEKQEMVELLVGRMDPEKIDTPLGAPGSAFLRTLQSQQSEIVGILLNFPKPVNMYRVDTRHYLATLCLIDHTPLLTFSEILTVMLAHESETNVRPKKGRTPLYSMVTQSIREKPELVKLLLENGEDPNAEEGRLGGKPYSLATQKKLDDFPKLFQPLFEPYYQKGKPRNQPAQYPIVVSDGILEFPRSKNGLSESQLPSSESDSIIECLKAETKWEEFPN